MQSQGQLGLELGSV